MIKENKMKKFNFKELPIYSLKEEEFFSFNTLINDEAKNTLKVKGGLNQENIINQDLETSPRAFRILYDSLGLYLVTNKFKIHHDVLLVISQYIMTAIASFYQTSLQQGNDQFNFDIEISLPKRTTNKIIIKLTILDHYPDTDIDMYEIYFNLIHNAEIPFLDIIWPIARYFQNRLANKWCKSLKEILNSLDKKFRECYDTKSPSNDELKELAFRTDSFKYLVQDLKDPNGPAFTFQSGLSCSALAFYFQNYFEVYSGGILIIASLKNK